MAIIRIIRPPMVTADMYEEVNRRMGVDADVPDGLIAHAAGDTGGQWEIVEVWESREQADRFDEERLRPAIEAVMGGPPPNEPQTTVYEAQRVILP
ncbi:MAG TPA: hypothetical protein VNV44_12270 [Solirubrobacteraceae bacterium]|jgi:hypothetical protein|nr:hypothetical protein [Solirubrobacteraceae bacterium]